MNQDKVTQAVFNAIQFTSDGKQLEGDLCETLAKGIAAGINAALQPIVEEVVQNQLEQGGIQPKQEQHWVNLHEREYTPCEVCDKPATSIVSDGTKLVNPSTNEFEFISRGIHRYCEEHSRDAYANTEYYAPIKTQRKKKPQLVSEYKGKLNIYPEVHCEECMEIIHNHLDCPVCGEQDSESEEYYDLCEYDIKEITCANCGSEFQTDSGQPYSEDAIWEKVK